MSGRGKWRRSNPVKTLTILGFAALLIIAAGTTRRTVSAQTSSSSGDSASAGYSNASSWALGVVVPNGVQLAGGGRLSWEDVNNVTAQVTLPEIYRTDGPVLAVLSLTTREGNVLQLAAGIYPATDRWLSYAWFISDIQAASQNYQWLADASEPEMSSGSLVTLSIFLSSGVWYYELSSADNDQSLHGEFPGGEASPLAAGDGGVFALESYSENSSVFSHMGNLTLASLTVDGESIVQGPYFYSNWVGQGNPLFDVGGYAELPSFISIEHSDNGTVVWSYAGLWTGQAPSLNFPVGFAASAILAACLAAAAIAFLRLRRTGHDPPKLEEEGPTPIDQYVIRT